MTTDHLIDPLHLPTTELATAALALVIADEPVAIANHSIRSYLFGRIRAEHLGARPGRDYDPQLLFLACVLHDIGLSAPGDRDQRFEVDGADAAAEFLTRHGLPSADVDAVWEAIALHTSPGIAERRGPLCELVRAGVGLDFGRDTGSVTDQDAARIHARYPRLEMEHALVDVIVAQARVRPQKAPRYSIAGELVRERDTPPHLTQLEAGAASSRWSLTPSA